MSAETKNIRNVIILGHSHSGKTSVGEALLFAGKTIQKAGSVPAGNTVSDYNDDEIERKMSINSSVLNLTHNGTKVNVIDTPGFIDFIGEIIGGLRAADAGILVVNAVSGIEMGTDKFGKMMKKKGIPFCIFINRMDKENADFDKCMEQINKKFGKNCACITYPIGSAATFKGVVNLLTKEGLDKVEGDDSEEAKMLSESLTESVAESDDALLEKYLEKGELSSEEIKSAFRKAVLTGELIPVLSGAATSGSGIKELLELITGAFPSPLDRPAIKALDPNTKEKVDVEPKSDGPFAAQVFKTIADPYLGQITIMKIFSGSLSSNASIYNVS
ncbi:MAG: GTP-binding protein [Candidatus Omnitrophica bacterium]|nr:GTP-binding protein [Candidatus Omnitrophota bacterium]